MAQTGNSFSTSASLIRRVKARDPEAWHRLSRLYGPLAYRWTRQCGLQPSDAADVVQNVFFSVSQSVDRYSSQGPKASFRGWLWTITRNAVREFHRQQATLPQAEGGTDAQIRFQEVAEPLDNGEDTPDSQEGFDATASLAHRALGLIKGDFEPLTWDAFWRTTIDNQPATEVGAALGMSAKAVRQAKYRVLCRLREVLADG
ncbi:MAG: sigma-70 family polymerase sigma factor [Planctomycetaceae bacterium]|nr:sigma-70 family polymerase sigma factor [Planctomycetaceae bacterium]